MVFKVKSLYSDGLLKRNKSDWQTHPIFDEPQDKPTKYDGLFGWSADWKCYLDQEDKPVPLDGIWSLSPDKRSVVVLKGDTLGQIASEYNCSVEELTEYNNIKTRS